MLNILVGITGIIALALTNLGTYLHESAHRFAAHLLYRVTEEHMRINPFLKGLLSGTGFGSHEFTHSGPATLGRYLGERGSKTFVYLAGPLTDTTVAFLLYITGMMISGVYPRASVACKAAGAVYFFSTLYHASGAILRHKGDLYLAAEQIGIPPLLVGFAFAVSLPLLVLVIYLHR